MKNNTHHQAKALWGATAFPFFENARQAYRSEAFVHIEEGLQNWIAHHASGVVDGDNGVGKSYLISRLVKNMDPKLYLCILLSHSTLQASGLIRQLCRRMGLEPRMQRGDNLDQIHQRCDNLAAANTWPVIIVDESQNLTAPSIEELRLINCHKAGSEVSFSVLFVGDKNLMPRLKMGVNHALLARLSFYYELTALSHEQTREYITARLQEVMIHQCPFDSDSIDTIIQISAGKPRIVNNLCRASMQRACSFKQSRIGADIVQKTIESIPWIHQIPT